MKYRKKPVEIEAFIWNPDTPVVETPDWYFECCSNGVLFPELDGTLSIQTLEGKMTAQIGDYIIKGIKDEINCCRSDIFEMSYEKVE